MTADFVTILTATGRRRAVKLIQPARDKTTWPAKDIPGQIDIIPYEYMKTFRAEERPVSSIYELAKILDDIERSISSFIVRGRIADGVDRNRMVRRVRDRSDGVDPTLLPAEHYWIALDLDAIPCPEYIDPAHEPKAAVEYVIDRLPEEFHNATCRWQFTSSQGFKTSTISLRRYFWADRPLSDSDLKSWLCACKSGIKIRRWSMIDGTVFSPAQPIYTAAPLICGGLRDPMPVRSGILFGACDEVLAPEIVPEHRRSGYSGHGGGTQAPGEPGLGMEGFCSRIGDHEAGDGFFRPIKSAVAAYIARHGSQVDTTWLRADLEAVIRGAPRALAKHPDDYVELRVSDLDPLIAAIVDMERAAEEAEKAAAEAPEDSDTPDELAVLVDQHWDEIVAWARQNIPGCKL